MKPGILASTILHGAALTWGLWSFSSPEPLDVSYAEALPVEIVMSEVFEGVEGEKDAPITETPAPTPTERPQTLPMPAENVGDNEADLDTPPVPEVKPNKVEPTPAPQAAEPPPPPPEPELEEPEVAEAAPEPPPQPEPEPVPAEPAPAEPDPVEAAIAEAAAAPEPQPQPQNVPVPRQKPRVPETRVAEAKPAEPPKAERREEPPKKPELAKPVPAKESEFNADEIAALLSNEKASGGGARRSTEVASLGSQKTTGTKLSSSQLGQIEGMLNEQMARCYSVPTGALDAEELKVSIRIAFDPSGELVGAPTIVRGGGGSGLARTASEAAVRAIKRCAPFNLPAELYEGGWEITTLNFDPSAMF